MSFSVISLYINSFSEWGHFEDLDFDMWNAEVLKSLVAVTCLCQMMQSHSRLYAPHTVARHQVSGLFGKDLNLCSTGGLCIFSWGLRIFFVSVNDAYWLFIYCYVTNHLKTYRQPQRQPSRICSGFCHLYRAWRGWFMFASHSFPWGLPEVALSWELSFLITWRLASIGYRVS